MAKSIYDGGPVKISEDVEYWTRELQAARDREKDYRKQGDEIFEIYDGRKPAPFNILYSNTETMAPALYSAVPIPVVQRRFKDDDPLGKAASQAAQRLLAFLLDTNLDGYQTFDECVKSAVQVALLPGRGETVVKYDVSLLGGEEPDGAPVMQYETVCCETKTWNRVLYGYAKTWNKVPWVAYEEHIQKDEATRLFGAKIANALAYTDADKADGDERNGKKDEPHQGARKTACIYQIWDRAGGRKIRYFAEQHKPGLLKVEDDPLQLTGFFNCPKPLRFFEKAYSQTPTSLYVLYKEQHEELNRLTRRIKNISNAIKARGLYDGALGDDLKTLMTADDNELVPTDNSASLAAEKGLDNAIWFMPVDKLIIVLRELLGAREQCKQTIYEITGISDILRGSTKASETLGAQKIKTQWGTLRLKNKQKEVVRFIVDLMRLMVEIAATKFSEETWAKMTGLPFLVSAKYNELTAIAKTLQAQLSLQPPPMPSPTGVPSPPPSPLVQQLQQVQQQLQAPQWAQVIQLLRDDLQRAYRIDIETNSSVELEAADDHENITELMTVMGQMLNGLTPLVTSGAMPFQAVQSLLLVVARRYRFGSEIEDSIKAMQPPTPPDSGKQQEAAMQQQMKMQQQQQQMQQVQMQADAQQKQQQMAMQQREAESSIRLKQMDAEMQIKQREMDLAVREAQLALQEEKMRCSQECEKMKMDVKQQSMQAKQQHNQGSRRP